MDSKISKFLALLFFVSLILLGCQFDGGRPHQTNRELIPETQPMIEQSAATEEVSQIYTPEASLPPTIVERVSTVEPKETKSTAIAEPFYTIFDVSVPSAVDQFEKLEIHFQVDGLTNENKQLPYLSAEDANEFIESFVGVGVSVDAVFTDPNGIEYRQPGYWHEGYIELMPTEINHWVVRFSPHLPGNWHVKLVAQHQAGLFESESRSFVVQGSNKRGFTKVAEQDSRYFEFDNGEYYSNIGFNLSIKQLADAEEIELLTASGVNYVRAWVSRMNITGGAWSHLSMKPLVYDGYLPRDAIARYRPNDKSEDEFWWRISNNHDWYSSCLYTNQEHEKIRVEPNTNYLVRADLATYDVLPADSGNPFGFTVIIQDWVDDCSQLVSSNAVINHSGDQNQLPLVREGVWNSGSNSTIPFVYLALDNVSAGDAYIKSVSIRKINENGSLGPELFVDYLADKRHYYSQRESAILDEMVEIAEENGLYLRLVLSEKQDPLFTKSDQYGRPTDDVAQLIYGSGRTIDYNRFLLMSWWRYAQARWGYSTAVHSWELLNEGDPFNADHYALADEMGKYMSCTVFGIEPIGDNCTYDHPNGHMVSTSFWHSFPAESFWGNESYPNIDFADQHKYLPRSDGNLHEELTMAVLNLSNEIGDGSLNDVNKPVLRGETGIVDTGTDGPISELRNGSNPIWLHNMLWSSLNAGGVIEAGYWYPYEHIFNNEFNHLNHFSEFASFVDSIPLNNGNYSALSGSFSDRSYVFLGQVDGSNQRAHGWLRHPDFTWKKVDGRQSEFGINGTLLLTGFEPNRSYTVSIQSYGLNSGYAPSMQSVTADGSGNLSISINTAGDAGSVAFKIE